MTRATLEEFIGLVDQLRAAREAYRRIEQKAYPGSALGERVPGSSDRRSKTEELGIELDEADKLLGVSELERAVQELRPHIVEFIAGVRGVEQRKVLILRVLKALPWKEVAVEFGAGTSEDAVYAIYARIVKQLPKQ